MDTPEIILFIYSILMLIPTIASITKLDQWWVRGFDFPRLQICFFVLLALIFSVFIYDFTNPWHILITALLIGSFIYQAVKIYPYTILAKKQVLKFEGEERDVNKISILVSNVLASNDQYHRLISHVIRQDPDMLLTLESDKKWEEKLDSLEKTYPFTVKIPQDNLYGMHLYSKLKLEEMEVKRLITEEIPSIHGYVGLRNGEKVRIHCLHPKPPSPSEDSTSTNRDAELLLVGKELDKDKEPILVFGDLNDVAWSRTTKLFQKISGLLDPRIGRGFFNTYHAGYSIFRWPLDHIFHTKDFRLIELRRLKSIGSDHFPILVRLNYKPRMQRSQGEPQDPDKGEKKWTSDKIDDGDPRSTDV